MTPWVRALTALRLLEIDPAGLGGIALQARSSPVRDAFLARLPRDMPRLHPAMTREALTGGIDVAASLSGGTLVRQKGLLERPGARLLLSMAERVPPLMTASLCAALGQADGTTLIALDEHGEDEAPPPPALLDRLAFHVSLDGLAMADMADVDLPKRPPVDFYSVQLPEKAVTDLVTLAVTLGITSLRAPSLALNAARTHAALYRRKSVTEADVIAAAELVLAPRATRVPEPPAPPEQQDRLETPDGDRQKVIPDVPDEILLAAIRTALPQGLLAETGSDTGKIASGSGAGHRRVGNRRGRPLPARNGGARSTQPKVDVVATLRAAVPWQTSRRTEMPNQKGPIIRPADLRYRRYEDLSDRLLVFAVDASGSAALARLAEAKGAVELLLAEAYARRDHVALIAFRGETAETLLPPTRSLVQTKRRLAALPGGGGTPLASGLSVGLETALTAKRKGMSPVLILLTDGRSNVTLSGKPDRAQAAEEATRLARQIAGEGIDTIVIDTGRRPERALQELSLSLRGRYVSLPRADAQRLSNSISNALST